MTIKIYEQDGWYIHEDEKGIYARTPVIKNCEIKGCKNIARINIQTQWHLYDLSKGGKYKERKSWEGDNNSHYCFKHANKELFLDDDESLDEINPCFKELKK